MAIKNNKAKEPEPKATQIKVWEIGGSGTNKQNGFIYEEYNSQLQGQAWIKKYEEMRNGDATIQAILLAMELPILSTKWEVVPGKTNWEITKADEEIADFINTALFEKISFKKFLRQSLTDLVFWFSVFEKVFKLEDWKIYWDKISQRLQKSIYKWEGENWSPGIMQNLYNEPWKENQVFIPRDKLIVFTHRQEGDNYEGRSALRAAFKHWYIKDQLYKYQAIAFEKQSVGIPIITMPAGSTEKDQIQAEEILAGIRSTEQTRILLPNDKWQFEFADMKGKSNADPEKAIAHHDRQITKAVLAHFMELWASEGGSYALSEDQSSLFMLWLQAIADEIVEVINKQAIEELVNINFTITENQTYPKVTYQKLGDIDLEKLINAITSATSGGLIAPDENIENKLRKILDLPEQVKETKKVEKKKVAKTEADIKNQIKDKIKEPKKKAENFIEEVKIFSEKTQVKESVAKNILRLIYKKGLDPKDLAIVIENLKYKLRDKIDVVKLLNKAGENEIIEVIEDLIDWQNEMWKNEIQRVSNSFTEEEIKSLGFADKEEMEAFKESKRIFNFVESINL